MSKSAAFRVFTVSGSEIPFAPSAIEWISQDQGLNVYKLRHHCLQLLGAKSISLIDLETDRVLDFQNFETIPLDL